MQTPIIVEWDDGECAAIVHTTSLQSGFTDVLVVKQVVDSPIRTASNRVVNWMVVGQTRYLMKSLDCPLEVRDEVERQLKESGFGQERGEGR